MSSSTSTNAIAFTQYLQHIQNIEDAISPSSDTSDDYHTSFSYISESISEYESSSNTFDPVCDPEEDIQEKLSIADTESTSAIGKGFHCNYKLDTQPKSAQASISHHHKFTLDIDENSNYAQMDDMLSDDADNWWVDEEYYDQTDDEHNNSMSPKSECDKDSNRVHDDDNQFYYSIDSMYRQAMGSLYDFNDSQKLHLIIKQYIQ